jgi:hypothetical protein
MKLTTAIFAALMLTGVAPAAHADGPPEVCIPKPDNITPLDWDGNP